MASIVLVCFTVGKCKVCGCEELAPSWDESGLFTVP